MQTLTCQCKNSAETALGGRWQQLGGTFNSKQGSSSATNRKGFGYWRVGSWEISRVYRPGSTGVRQSSYPVEMGHVIEGIGSGGEHC